MNTQCLNCKFIKIKDHKYLEGKKLYCEKKDGFPDNFENDCVMIEKIGEN